MIRCALRCKSALGFVLWRAVTGEAPLQQQTISGVLTGRTQKSRSAPCTRHIDMFVVQTLVAIRESSIRGRLSSQEHYCFFGGGGLGFGVPVVSYAPRPMFISS